MVAHVSLAVVMIRVFSALSSNPMFAKTAFSLSNMRTSSCHVLAYNIKSSAYLTFVKIAGAPM